MDGSSQRKRRATEGGSSATKLPRNKPSSYTSALEWLLAPSTSLDTFFARHWESQPLFAELSQSSPLRYDQLCIEGNTYATKSKGRSKPLFDTARLLEIAHTHGPLHLGQQLQVMRVGQQGREQAEPPEDGMASDSWLSTKLDQGYTVQLFQPQHYCDRLWALLAALESELGCLCGCSVYHTPPGCQGLAPHHDDVEVFILQTQGKKRWKLYPPLHGHALPATPSPDLNEADLKPCIMDIVLSPGDLLYMPRGVIHQAVSLQGSSSTHLTLSAYQRHAWSDLLAAMLPKLLERASHASVDLRRGLPRNFLGHAGSGAQRGAPSRERASFEACATASWRCLLDHVNASPNLVSELAHEAADDIGADFMQNRLPPFTNKAQEHLANFGGAPASSVGPPPMLDHATVTKLEVRLCAPTLRRLVIGCTEEGDEYVQIQHCMRNRRECHMTRARGTGMTESRDFEIEDEDGGKEEEEEEEESDDESNDEGVEHGEEEEEGGEEEEDEEEDDEEEEEEGDEDDDESAWKHLFFPRLALSPLTKLVEAYPEWLPLSQLHEAAMGSGFGELQAVFMGCWADGVLESRATRNDSVDEDEFVDISTLQASSSAETRHGARDSARLNGPTDSVCKIGSRRGAWDTAVAWVRENGGIVQGIEFDEPSGGVKAATDLDPGAADSTILSIPVSLCVTLSEATRSKVGHEVSVALSASDGPDGSPEGGASAEDIILSFHLAAEAFPLLNTDEPPATQGTSTKAAAAPFHAPYYATLPRPYAQDDPRTMLPRCWSNDEIRELLNGSPSAEEASRSRIATRADYERISVAVRRTAKALPKEWPPFEAYDWAASIVGSRAFSVETADGGTLDAMVPLMDMLNHSRPRETTYSLVGDGSGGGSGGGGARMRSKAAKGGRKQAIESPRGAHAIEMRVLRPCPRGTAVHDTYGAKGNAQLLNTYGFTVVYNVEPDGSSNDIRPFALPTDASHNAAPSLIYQPQVVAPLRLGPTPYAARPFTIAVDAHRAAVFAAWESQSRPNDKPLKGAALEVRALQSLRAALANEIAGYALSKEAARERLLSTPASHPSRTSAAACVVFSEHLTLQLYRYITTLCLEVLAPKAASGAVQDGETMKDRRRAAARRLRELADEAHSEGGGSGRAEDEYEEARASSRCGVEALERLAGRRRAAPIAMAYLKIRFPALLQ